MGLRRSRLTLIFINVILFFALCAKPISSQGNEDIPPPSLPKIGLQKSLGDQNGDPTKLAIAHLEHLKQSIEEYRQAFPQRKACWKVPDSAKACYDQCIEKYDVAIDLITSSIESLNKQDIPKAKSDVSNVATDIQNCQDCFEQSGNGGDQYIKDINIWVKGQAQWCLDNMLNKLQNGVHKLSVDQNGKKALPAPPLPKLGVKKSLGDPNDDAAYAILHVERMEQYIGSWKSWFEKEKQCPYLSPEQKMCCDQCQGNIDHAVECGKAGIQSLNNNDFTKTIGDVNCMVTDIQTCNDCFTQVGNGREDEDVKKLNDFTKDSARDCLAVLKEAENGVQKLSAEQNYKKALPAPPLPKLGVQKSLGDQNGDSAKATIEHLDFLKPAIEDYKQWFPQKKACPATPESAKPCCDQCQENYGAASDFITGSIESLNKQDLPKARSDMSNIDASIQKCQACFEQTGNGGDQEIKNINQSLKTYIEWCLGLLNTAESGVQKLSVDQNDDATQRAIEQLEGIKHHDL